MKNISLFLYIVLAPVLCSSYASQSNKNKTIHESCSRMMVLQYESFTLGFSHQSKRRLEAWMKNSGIWDKCGEDCMMNDLLTNINTLLEKQPMEVLELIRTSGALDKCKDGGQICTLFREVNALLERKPMGILTQMKELGVLDKCLHGYDLSSLLNVASLVSTEYCLRILELIRISGALDKCQNGYELTFLFLTIYSLPAERFQEILSQIKMSKAWDKCQNGVQIGAFLSLFGDLGGAFRRLGGSLIKICLLDYGYLQDILEWHKKRNNKLAKTILSTEQSLLNFDENIKFYVFCHAFRAANIAVEEKIKDKILNEPHPEFLLEIIFSFIGRNHEFSQRCLNLFSGERHLREGLNN